MFHAYANTRHTLLKAGHGPHPVFEEDGDSHGVSSQVQMELSLIATAVIKPTCMKHSAVLLGTEIWSIWFIYIYISKYHRAVITVMHT